MLGAASQAHARRERHGYYSLVLVEGLEAGVHVQQTLLFLLVVLVVVVQAILPAAVVACVGHGRSLAVVASLCGRLGVVAAAGAVGAACWGSRGRGGRGRWRGSGHERRGACPASIVQLLLVLGRYWRVLALAALPWCRRRHAAGAGGAGGSVGVGGGQWGSRSPRRSLSLFPSHLGDDARAAEPDGCVPSRS